MKNIILTIKRVFILFSIQLLIRFASIIYCFIKLCTKENPRKVVFLSWQKNKPSLDAKLIQKELIKRMPDVETVIISRHLEKSVSGIILLGVAFFRSLYHLATSRVCVLESYWPAVSILRHRDSLLIIQIWHAMGKMKRSGYQTLNRSYGRGKDVAKLLKMHHGYDFVIAGGAAMNQSYCESFGIKPEILLNYGLPRMDDLLLNQSRFRMEFLEMHPKASDKRIILYVPTFRKQEFSGFEQIIRSFSGSDFCLMIRPHTQQPITNQEILNGYLYPSIPLNMLLSACDYVITDYSAVLFEAAVIRKKTYIFLPDHDQYIEKNGLNIDPMILLKSISATSSDELRKRILTEEYSFTTIDWFAEKYLPNPLGKATEQIANVILTGLCNGKEVAKNLYTKQSICLDESKNMKENILL